MELIKFRKELVGKIQASKSCFRCRHSKQSYRSDIPPCYGLKVHFFVVLDCERGGGKKDTFEVPNLRGPRQGSTGKTSQDKPTLPRAAPEVRWPLVSPASVAFRLLYSDLLTMLGFRLAICLLLACCACQRQGSSWVHNPFFGK